jgi:hypothetical protein
VVPADKIEAAITAPPGVHIVESERLQAVRDIAFLSTSNRIQGKRRLQIVIPTEAKRSGPAVRLSLQRQS